MICHSLVLPVVLTGLLFSLTACDSYQETAADAPPSRLEAMRERGSMTCASHANFPGFGYVGGKGEYRGFDIDQCRAVAAVLGYPEAIEVKPMTFAQREAALKSGQIDMMTVSTTWTTGREARWGDFAAILSYNGQGFMVRADSAFDSASDLGGTTVCVTASTTTEHNLADFFRENGMSLETVTLEDRLAVYEAYEEGRCGVVTDDVSALAAIRHGFDAPGEHMVLPDVISKEPLSPLTPHGDEQWQDVVSTVMYVLITAEELGVTQDNVDSMKSSNSTLVLRKLCQEGEFGPEDLGLDADFAVDVIKAVGNYGDIYDRYMGPEGESFTMPRGVNRLWTDVGLIYAPTLR